MYATGTAAIAVILVSIHGLGDHTTVMCALTSCYPTRTSELPWADILRLACDWCHPIAKRARLPRCPSCSQVSIQGLLPMSSVSRIRCDVTPVSPPILGLDGYLKGNRCLDVSTYETWLNVLVPFTPYSRFRWAISSLSWQVIYPRAPTHELCLPDPM